ncbi:MAG: hypothetical protein VBE63_19675 [Lamprobacter sp.]|uniref:hypothetical protein n=1 Tax=Lamprobacter sp. TaxID=3100796 RepID=UPI002B2629DB|nr:hypothetical protein [Lamprobacter sp.]MEA3642138.1 hypothetical protein [Lamprobacter sp.]
MTHDKADSVEKTSPVEAAEAALDRLAAKLAPPSIGAQIRRLLPKIENAIEAGATHEQILETLRESGIEMTIATFRSAFYRARSKRNQTQTGRQEGGRERSNGYGSPEDLSSSDGEQCLKGASKTERDARSGADVRQASRDPLAVPKRPKSFDWDPTARPEVTFINKDDDRTDTEH